MYTYAGRRSEALLDWHTSACKRYGSSPTLESRESNRGPVEILNL